MKELLEYQKAFYKAIFTNEPMVLQNTIGEIDAFNERFKIYSNNIFASLKNVLKDDFPISKRVLGEQKFNQASFEFVRNFPPTSGCLLNYGEKFPRFLGIFFPTILYLQDIAQIEWAKKEIYYKSNSCPLDPMVLSSIPSDEYTDLTFEFPEATFFFESVFSLQEIWEDPEKEKNLKLTPSYSLIIRPRYKIQHYWLSEEEFSFLKALYEKKTLGEAYERAAELNPKFDLSKTLESALTREYFSKTEVYHENRTHI
ncbi:MAG: DNA-binding domain-containing protein [Flavobacteriales bacterium]|nr:DNA-binding domain-containing protein [Flavobacteriales bacterium]